MSQVNIDVFAYIDVFFTTFLLVIKDIYLESYVEAWGLKRPHRGVGRPRFVPLVVLQVLGVPLWALQSPGHRGDTKGKLGPVGDYRELKSE